MLKTIFEALKVLHVSPDGSGYAVAAGTSDVNSESVDSLGYNRVGFVMTFGDNADTGTFTGKIQGSANGSTGWTDITGATVSFTAGASDTDNKMIGVECDVNPTYRYYRFASDRGTANTVIAALHAILGRAVGQPVSQSTATGQFISSPVVV